MLILANLATSARRFAPSADTVRFAVDSPNMPFSVTDEQRADNYRQLESEALFSFIFGAPLAVSSTQAVDSLGLLQLAPKIIREIRELEPDRRFLRHPFVLGGFGVTPGQNPVIARLENTLASSSGFTPSSLGRLEASQRARLLALVASREFGALRTLPAGRIRGLVADDFAPRDVPRIAEILRGWSALASYAGLHEAPGAGSSPRTVESPEPITSLSDMLVAFAATGPADWPRARFASELSDELAELHLLVRGLVAHFTDEGTVLPGLNSRGEIYRYVRGAFGIDNTTSDLLVDFVDACYNSNIAETNGASLVTSSSVGYGHGRQEETATVEQVVKILRETHSGDPVDDSEAGPIGGATLKLDGARFSVDHIDWESLWEILRTDENFSTNLGILHEDMKSKDKEEVEIQESFDRHADHISSLLVKHRVVPCWFNRKENRWALTFALKSGAKTMSWTVGDLLGPVARATGLVVTTLERSVITAEQIVRTGRVRSQIDRSAEVVMNRPSPG